MILTTIILAASTVVLDNASIPPAPETVPGKVFVLSCGPKQETVLTNLKNIPSNCKVVKEYETVKK